MMFRLNLLNTAERLRTSAYPKPLIFRLLRSRSFVWSDSPCGDGVLPSSVVRLTCESAAEGGICNVYLIGTLPYDPYGYDFSARTREAENMINSLKPQVVFLGLCPTLAHDLRPYQMPKRIVGRFFDKKVLAEFRVARKEAQKHGGKVILGNRPDKIAWHKSSRPSLLISSLLSLCPNRMSNFAEKILDPDKVLNVPFVKSFALQMKKFYVDECDQYMSATLLEVAREHNSVVAVVRSMHLPGIQNYWKQPIEVEDISCRRYMA